MKNQSLHRLLAVTACALVTFGLLAPATAQAGTRSITGYGPRGGTYHKQVSRTPGSYATSASATLPNGKTANRTVTSQKTDTGRTTSAQATGFNGKTATYDSTRTRTDDGYTRQATATGRNGGTATKQVDVSSQNGTTTRTAKTTVTPPQK